MQYIRVIFLLVVQLFLWNGQGYGQSYELKLHELLYSSSTLKQWKITDTSLLQAFYKVQTETLFWQRPMPASAKLQLLQLLERSHEYGLNKSDYHYEELAALTQESKTAIDSIKADIVFTDGLMHFLSDLRYGNTPSFEYNGLPVSSNQQELISLLLQWVESANKTGFIEALEPDTREYKAMKDLWRLFNIRIVEKEYREDSIVSNKVDVANKPLLLKLYHLGLIDTSRLLTNKDIVAAVKKAQHQFDLAPDGRIGKLTLKALNITLAQRAEAIKVALNDLRWLHRFYEDTIAVINIPSAMLYVYGKGDLVLASRLVVGKQLTPTPTLASYIQEVILYPYWNVPYSIATKELLPSIKQNRGYLAANNFQVLNKQGKVLDPNTINWKSLSATNFPYFIRQSTGCDNSLGLVKFNLNNPFSVYLHDTPSKGLFALQKRYLSHGCMRVERPVELAEVLLGEEKAAVKALTEKCLLDQKPSVFPLKKPMPIAVLYNTTWYDKNGNVLFYDNVYNK